MPHNSMGKMKRTTPSEYLPMVLGGNSHRTDYIPCKPDLRESTDHKPGCLKKAKESWNAHVLQANGENNSHLLQLKLLRCPPR